VNIVSNTIRPSPGVTRYAVSKNGSHRAFPNASNASMLTIRSTGSSNCSQPCSSTRLLRGLSISSNIRATWARWFLERVSPITLTSYFSIARRIVESQPQPMSSNVTGLEAQLAQRAVDFGDLRLLQGHVLTLEVGAAVGLLVTVRPGAARL
jgi:hypothetical protein